MVLSGNCQSPAVDPGSHGVRGWCQAASVEVVLSYWNGTISDEGRGVTEERVWREGPRFLANCLQTLVGLS